MSPMLHTPQRSRTVVTPEQLRLREIESELGKLDSEKRTLDFPCGRLRAELGRFPTAGEEDAAKRASAPRRRQILDAMKLLRDERKTLKEAEREAREARALANRLAKQTARESITAECQICEGRQCLNRDGTMVHHGYLRPGDGEILGDCFGVKRLPYPETDALVEYLTIIRQRHAGMVVLLAKLPEREDFFEPARFHGDKARTYIKAETDAHTWKRLVQDRQWRYEAEIASLSREITRVTARIAAAKGGGGDW